MLSRIFILFGCVSVAVLGQSSPGDPCKINETNEDGICKIDCPAIALTIKKRRPTTCGFQGTSPIVCCPLSGALPANTPPRAPVSSSAPPVTPSSTESKSEFSLSRSNCAKYGEAVYETITVSSSNTPLREKKCTARPLDSFVGKTVAEPKEFPHMALIGVDSPNGVRYSCAGALVSEKYVITAAHCVFGEAAGYPKVVKFFCKDESLYFGIHRIIPHPSFEDGNVYHDVALVQLEKPVVFTPYIRPICLPDSTGTGTRGGGSVVAATWESLGEFNAKFVKAALKVTEYEVCRQSYADIELLEKGIDQETHICAQMDANSGENSCPINVGGPLHILNKDVHCTYTLVGFSSFARACGYSEAPVVYSRIAPFVSWIETIIWT